MCALIQGLQLISFFQCRSGLSFGLEVGGSSNFGAKWLEMASAVAGESLWTPPWDFEQMRFSILLRKKCYRDRGVNTTGDAGDASPAIFGQPM